jgi:hypothetical protein
MDLYREFVPTFPKTFVHYKLVLLSFFNFKLAPLPEKMLYISSYTSKKDFQAPGKSSTREHPAL